MKWGSDALVSEKSRVQVSLVQREKFVLVLDVAEAPTSRWCRCPQQHCLIGFQVHIRTFSVSTLSSPLTVPSPQK